MLEFCKMLGELTVFLINITADFWNAEHFFYAYCFLSMTDRGSQSIVTNHVE